MSAGLVISVVICFIASALFIPVGPRIWRNEWGYAWDPERGGPLWRGFVRITIISGPFLGLTALLNVVYALSDHRLTAAFRIGAVLWMGLIVCAVTIVLFNRPKRLVAPHLRHQPGAIAEWLGRKVAPTPPPRHRPLRRRPDA
jgi:hypothetical protein